MKQSHEVPSLAELALQYGTINKQQLDHLLGMQKKTDLSFSDLMRQEKMATEYQMSLIQLIREFLVLKQQGEKFGQIAVKKGFATKEQVDAALKKQIQQFREEKLKRMIGDILVESGIITTEQRKIIAREQKLIELKNSVKLEEKNAPPTLPLSPEEQDFLRIKNLDKIFAETVIEKGFATKKQVNMAMEIQEREFKRQRSISLLGDVMVGEGFLTPAQRNLILAEQKRLDMSKIREVPFDNPDFEINVTVSQDAMEAWAEMPKAREFQPPLALLKAVMEKKGVKYGILRDEILQCFMEKQTPRFILAKGDLPSILGGPKVKYLFERQENPPEKKQSKPIPEIKVERGTPLARLEKITQTIHGKDVLGNTLEKELPRRKEPNIFNCGNGTKISKNLDRVFAGKSGMPFLSLLGSLHVLPQVNVLDDADMKFGAIEPYASLSVAGILTGAYPVKAGRIKAREIRDTLIESLGDINVSIGITNAVIKTQGSVRASYIHNSTIEAFGNVVVENEILDSTIIISGQCAARKSRIIASSVSARGGVMAQGVGSDVTEPCRISAGKEEHLVLELERIAQEIDLALKKIRIVEKNTRDILENIDQTFKKMVRLKRLYDTAKAEKARHNPEPQKRNVKTETLVKALDKKLDSAIKFLKTLNKRKRTMETALKKLKITEARTRPKLEARIETLERKRFQLLDWNKKTQGLAEIMVNGRLAQGTILSGAFSSTIIKEACQNVKILETPKKDSTEGFELISKEL